MVEYNLGLSQKLAETAEVVAMDGLEYFDAMQTVIDEGRTLAKHHGNPPGRQPLYPKL